MNSDKQTSNKLIDSKDLQSIWKLIKKNLGILILVPTIAYCIGFIYAYRLKDVYGANAQLLLKSNETYDYQDPIYKGLGAYSMYMDVSNQIRILQSRDIIEEVVDKIDVNISYFISGRLKKKEVFGTLPFKAEIEIYNSEQLYELPLSVKILDNDNYTLSYIIGDQEKKYQGNFEEELITQDFGIKLSKNYEFSSTDIDRVLAPDYEIIAHSRAHMVGHFKSRIAVENIEFTSILDINITDDIESRAKVFLDTLCAVFIDYSQRSQLEVNKNTLANIEKQIEEVQKILVVIEDELLNYKEDNDIIHLTKEEDAYFTMFVDYTEKNRELRYKLNSVKSLEDYVQNSEDERLLPPSFYILEGDFYLQTKVNEFYALQLNVKDTELSVKGNHPTVKKLKDDIVTMRKDILVYLKNLQVAIQSQIAQNEQVIGKYKNDVQGIPRSMQGIENIKRELEVNNKMYLFLLEKKTNTQIARAGIIPQVQLIESASSTGLIGPDKGRIKQLFLLGGLLLALLIAVVRKIFFERIENVIDLDEATTLPIIGGIPFLKDRDTEIVVEDKPKSQVTESFRTIRSNISFLGSDENAKLMLISSFFPGEGKTFCSTNLGALLAKSGKKVLLVDFDLHKPKVHKNFGLDNNVGISNLIIQNKKLEEIIQKDVFPNLDIITSGPIPPNPSELLLSSEVGVFVDKIKQQYDFVIFDTPPFGLLNDAIELTQYSNVFLAVLNTKFARKRGVEAIEKTIIKDDTVSYGMVLNGVRQSKLGYYYNKYSYKYSYRYSYSMGAGYGYGYGQEYGEETEK